MVILFSNDVFNLQPEFDNISLSSGVTSSEDFIKMRIII